MNSDYQQLIELAHVFSVVDNLYTKKRISRNDLELDNYLFSKLITYNAPYYKNRLLENNHVMCVFKYAQTNYKKVNMIKKFIITASIFENIPHDCRLDICKYII